MSVEDIKKRFVNEIKLRAYDDKYLDKNEEREILQIAIQLGVSIDSARGALVQVCDEHSYVLESQLIKQIQGFGGSGGRQRRSCRSERIRPDFPHGQEVGRRQEERSRRQEDDRHDHGRDRQQQGENRLVQRLVHDP